MKKFIVGKDQEGAPIEVEIDENDRFMLKMEVLRLPRSDEDAPVRKGYVETGPLDYGAYVAVQGLAIDLQAKMNVWGVQAASAMGVVVPGKNG